MNMNMQKNVLPLFTNAVYRPFIGEKTAVFTN